jgi:hypothetical protein
MAGGTLSQPLIEVLTIHHTDKPTLNRHIDRTRARRDHTRCVNPRDQ